VLLISEYIR